MKYILTLLMSSLLFFSCSQTAHIEEDEDAKPSGFLGSYDELSKGTDDQVNSRYIAKDIDWKKYKKVNLKAVEVWAGKDSELKEIDKEDLKSLLTYMHAEMQIELVKSFQLTDQAGPDVLEIRFAMTDGDSSNVALDTISTVLPIGLALSFIKKWTLGTHLQVGEAHMEFEVLDSVSRKRLAAGIDARAGTKALKGKFDKWNDVKESFEFWTQKMRYKLVDLGSGTPTKEDKEKMKEEKEDAEDK
ncbi:DUF3313 domain-containing protein [Lentisphaera profundi]|uniref:DUF3313 domain-containing protein n=1 Tax=Lentisphaera profundi TaxID=1658616 RepID=A0ABY7VQF2_9BACT|nr:DUF3313 domain-containing protein [Lentisphaera profundi]WDE96227.1 DUF3313 domain-containing protein [Lentisphaera profundi]